MSIPLDSGRALVSQGQALARNAFKPPFPATQRTFGSVCYERPECGVSFSLRGVADAPDARRCASPELVSLTGLSRLYKKKDCESLNLQNCRHVRSEASPKLKTDKRGELEVSRHGNAGGAINKGIERYCPSQSFRPSFLNFGQTSGLRSHNLHAKPRPRDHFQIAPVGAAHGMIAAVNCT